MNARWQASATSSRSKPTDKADARRGNSAPKHASQPSKPSRLAYAGKAATCGRSTSGSAPAGLVVIITSRTNEHPKSLGTVRKTPERARLTTRRPRVEDGEGPGVNRGLRWGLG